MGTVLTMLCSILDLPTLMVGVTVFLIAGYFMSKREIEGIPPGPSFLPLLGNFIDMKVRYLNKIHIYFDDLAAQYGSVFRIYFGRKLTIVLNDYDSITEALVKQKEIFTARPSDKLWDVKESAKTGLGIIWSNDDKWKSIRRSVLHAFRDLGVGKESLEERINDETTYIIEDFIKSNEQPLEVHGILMKATSNIMSGVVFGKRFEYDDPEFIHLIQIISAAFEGDGPYTPINVLSQIRFLPVVAGKMRIIIRGILHVMGFISTKIDEHKSTLEEGNPRDFIDICLLNNKTGDGTSIEKDVLLKTVLDLFFAGTDTTANTLDWGFLYSILYPEIQQKCQKEIDDVVGANRMVRWADRTKMPYVEATLLELQRLSNIAAIALPHTNIEDTKVKGFLIPKGSIVVPHIRALHLNDTVWDNPFTFQPERFLNEDGKPFKPPHFMPFSTGPRICPGETIARMELFLIFTNILQKFSITKVGNKDLSTDGVFGVTMAPKPYKFKAIRR